MNETNNPDKKRILIIDDNTQIHQDFKKILLTSKDEESDLGKLEETLLEKEEEQPFETYTLDCVSQGEEGLKMVKESIKKKEPYAVAFIDVRMPPGLDGIETISKIWQIYPDIQIVICTAYSDYSWAELFNKFGHTDKLLILKKPFDNIEVRQLTYNLCKKWELNKIANLKMNELEEIVQERTRELQHSEEKYRTIIEHSNDMIWMLNTKGEFAYFNKRSAELTGYKIEEGIGKTFIPIILEEDLEMVGKVFKDTLAGNSNHYEVRIHDSARKNILTLSVNTAPIFEDGKVTGTVSFGRNITEQKSAEEALRESEEKYRNIFEHSPFGIVTFDDKGNPINANKEVLNILGSPSIEDTRQINVLKYPPLQKDGFSSNFLKCLKTGEVISAETKYISKWGKESFIHYTMTPIHIKENRIGGILSIFEDISERFLAEKALQESEKRFRQFFANSPEYCFIISLEGTILDINKSGLKALGYLKKEIVGKPLLTTIYAPSSQEKAQKLFIKWSTTGELKNEELNMITKDGKERTVLLSVDAIRGNKGEIIYSILVQRDITERKQVEKALKESEQLSRAVVEGSPIGISVRNCNGTLLLANETWQTIWELTNKQVAEYSKPRKNLMMNEKDAYLGKHIEEVKKVYENGGEYFIPEIELLGTNNKKAKWISQHFYAIKNEKSSIDRVVILTEDITERKQAERIQSVLYNIANVVNTTKDIHELFEAIRDHLSAIVNTDNFYIALYDKEQDTFSLPYHTDEKDKFDSFPAGKTLTAYVVRAGKSLFATEEKMEKLIQAGEVEKGKVGAPAKIWVGVPLRLGKEILGIIAVQSYTHASLYSERDLEILEFVSDEIALAIAQKQAEEDLKNKNKELTAFNKIAVGREMRMIDLKKEINELLDKLGKESKYKIAE